MEGTSLLFWRETPLSALEQVSANRYVTMVIYQKLLPRTKKRGVFYLSLKISSLHRLASYDEYPPACGKGVKIPLRGEGAGSSVCYTLPRPSPRRSVLFYTNSNMVTLRSWSTPLLQESTNFVG